MCVVSGKLSEGINFADGLGRGVVMIGMPYANMASLELQEKLSFMQQAQKSTSSTNFAKEYYDNMCMRAVNQSIGRAIRHGGDYACILLLDHRYERVKGKLPGWIRDAGVGIRREFGGALKEIGKFFEGFE